MNSFFTIVKLDYLHRTRSYNFLITLCASLAIAYTFVPEPNANYSTIRISNYVGYYNSAWFGYVTAIMTSIFLSLIGFYLVNSAIKTDVYTKVGQITATTKINNFSYLLSKVISNFLVLSTITCVVFLMSILLFFLYNDGFTFEIFQFIKPYIIITLPSLFIVSVLSVLFEVFLGKYSIIQNIGFFFIFSILMVFSPKTEQQFSLDIFGSKIVMHQLEEKVKRITNSDKETSLNIGYVIGNVKKTNKFEFSGVNFPTMFILSRILWMICGVLIIFLISPLFHRFNITQFANRRKKTILKSNSRKIKTINLSNLPKPHINYSIIPLLKVEFLLLFRKDKKWHWLISIIGMVLLAVLPLKIAHQMVLPILWFFQVNKLSDIATKEITNNVHYFVFTAYQPINRVFVSQLFSGITFILVLALPLIIRLGIANNFTALVSVLLGGVFIVLFTSTLGMLSKGKKLFEVLFFMISYANINGIVFLDYFGGFEHHKFYLIQLISMVLLFGTISILMRFFELKKK